MRRLCPTIHELLAFDAVARYESLTHAAGSLCITVSAVSKQISSLEEFVGRPLLQRNGRGVALTGQGRLYWQKISGSLRALETATFEMQSGDGGAGILTLASVPTFLTKWLIPRLPDFRKKSPSVTLSFTQHLGPDEEMPSGVDAAIRYGHGEWPGVVSDYIAGKAFVLIAAPGLIASGRLGEPYKVPEHTLLHHEGAPSAWRQWAAHHGVAESAVQSGPRFAQYSAVIQAVVSGLGIGLVPRILVLEELTNGSLAVPCGDLVTVDQGHYLCFRADRMELPVLAAFRSWILAQARG
ncbi:LysR substrate-binding domain-containing protein [Polaromonas jejuensis]|uniref:LysR substrate-binding domain-containing protein n=1 Tax=Polaromonas jejuensis TaxID=457502 RepID=A0ABW0QBK3_9BURK|nr:LysR substrate-binding domain-containing protein [Polaromonas jejuensis]